MISKHFEPLKMVILHKKIVLPNETNLNIQFCLIIFLWAFKKSIYFGFLLKIGFFATFLRRKFEARYLVNRASYEKSKLTLIQ